MGFNDWIRIDPAPMALDARLNDIDEEAKADLAAQIQTNLRGRIDPGIDLKSARRAQAVRATAKGGQIIIDEHDQDSVLRGGMEPQRDISQAQAGGAADLFTMSSGVPQIETRADGTRRMVFRTIAAKDVFAQQAKKEQDRTVENTVTETVRNGVVDAFQDAAKNLDRQHPEEKIK